jgi:hypothetical protein
MNSLAIGQDIRLNRTVTKIKYGSNQVQVRGRALGALIRSSISEAAGPLPGAERLKQARARAAGGADLHILRNPQLAHLAGARDGHTSSSPPAPHR